MKKEFRIGMAGYSGIGRVHALGYKTIPLIYPDGITPVLQRVGTSRQETADRAQADAGFIHASGDVAALASSDDVDVVDITLPNQLHLEVIREAAAAGKAIYCEKPLSGTISEAEAIAELVAQTGIQFGMVFQYRFFPAIIRAKQIMEEGLLGKIFTYRFEYLHSGYQNPARPLTWRMQKEKGGSGALGDLGSHVLDLVRFLVGEFDSVQGMLHTFIKERPLPEDASRSGEVTVDDVAWVNARMTGGAVGTIECSRFATGTLDDLKFTIHGERGALRFDLMDPGFISYYDDTKSGAPGYGGSRGWQRLESMQNYPGAKTPPPRAPIGWERAHSESQYQFLSALAEGKQPSPGIEDGLKVQYILDAVEISAENSGSWTEVRR